MLDLHLRPSPRLNLLLALAHLLSLGSIWILPLETGLHLAGCFLLLASYLHYLRHDGLLASPGSLIRLRFDQQGRCDCQTLDGTWHEATLLDSTLCTPWLLVFNLKMEGRWFIRHAVALSDSADAEALRKLRVLLRWKHPATNKR